MRTTRNQQLRLLCEQQRIPWTDILTGTAGPTVNVNMDFTPEAEQTLYTAVGAMAVLTIVAAAVGSRL